MSPRYHLLACRAALCAVVGVCFSIVATEVDAAGRLVLGPSDNITLDQPRVAVELFDVANPADPESLGPSASNTFLLDTGANSILAFGPAVKEMNDLGYTTDGTFDELGVGGVTTYDVSAAYRFDFAGSNGIRQTLAGTRILSDQDENAGGVGSFNGIVGMPGMVGRVTTLDYSGWSGGLTGDLSNIYMSTEFSTTVPAGLGHRYSVVAQPKPFTPEGATSMPAWAPVPFLDATAADGSEAYSGEFLFDTGAQMSMLSEHAAFAMQLDTDGDGNFDNEAIRFETITGISGDISVPVLEVDEIRLPTEQGVDLVWTNLQLLVMEIHEEIDGIVGSDLLTSGWFGAVFAGSGEDGYIEKVHLDFRDFDTGPGTIYFDLNPAVDHVTPEPSSLALLLVGTLLLAAQLRRRALRC